MKNKPINKILSAVEATFFGGCFAVFMTLNFLTKINIANETASKIYIIFMLISFGWLFAYEFLFKKLDNAVHYKMFAKYFKAIPRAPIKKSYKRKGLKGVILLWIAYLSVVAFVKYLKLLTWQLFLAGMSFLFLLNSFFTRKKCLLSLIFLKNKNHCCKNCGINCWDYSIFASALIFAPKLSTAATVINWLIITVSVVILIMWEYNFHKYPYRFYPETNASLKCKNCLKQCYKQTTLTKGEKYEV